MKTKEKDTVKIFKVIREFASGAGDETTTLVNRFSTLDKAKNFIINTSKYELIPITKERKHIYAVREDTKNILDSVHYYIEAEEIDKPIEKLNEPLTLADFLGWEEEVEYEYYPAQDKKIARRAKIVDNIFYRFIPSIDDFGACPIDSEDIPNMQQAKKVKKKPKAYHVKDEYSYKCLMEELEEQGYAWSFTSDIKPTDSFKWDTHKNNTVIYCEKNKILVYSHLRYFNENHKDSYDLIEYYKEEPKFHAFVKGTHIQIRDLLGDVIIATKLEWEGLDINDTNADFEEEVEKDEI